MYCWSHSGILCTVGPILEFYVLLAPFWNSVYCWSHSGILCTVGPILEFYVLLAPFWNSMYCWSHSGILCTVGPILEFCVLLVHSDILVARTAVSWSRSVGQARVKTY